MRFTYEVLPEFSDETRWLVIFNTKSLIASLAGVSVGVIFTKLTNALFGVSWPGITIGIILVLAMYSIFSFKTPEGDYLHGGGQKLEHFLINRIYRLRNKVLYMRGIER